MLDPSFVNEVQSSLDQLREELLHDRGNASHWTGELSASALSTATAVSALSLAHQATEDESLRASYRRLILRGYDWLSHQQNDDGGFGDTNRSHSNIATSFLVQAAQTLAATSLGPADDVSPNVSKKVQRYLEASGGIAALRHRYGTDNTFVVPILNNMAIAGLVSWDEVAALPFEAAVFPQSMYRFLGMPVVSYAVPALVAIGQAKFLRQPCRFPWRFVRRASIEPTLRVLQRMQPDSGGYLEATPLTAFVVMSLIDAGRIDHSVVRRGLEFLENSMTDEGSWPIDTNLATWVTSLSVAAISEFDKSSLAVDAVGLTDWLLSCQHRVRHPFTGADPGGWGWTDLSGSVPDADDTPGAMIALSHLREFVNDQKQSRIDAACRQGRDWLLGLQNRDGGWPTFCRGWGKLPFDRSSVDLTANAIRALHRLPKNLSEKKSVGRAISRGLAFLRKKQLPDGSWLPLWFGNQDRPDEDNPVYGTAKVLVDVDPNLGINAILRGIAYLIGSQNSDGGWGGGVSVTAEFGSESTVEETSLAIEALASILQINGRGSIELPASVCESIVAAILLGTRRLVNQIAGRRHEAAWPIGFYFAKLWYHERLYPSIFATAALSRIAALQQDSPSRLGNYFVDRTPPDTIEAAQDQPPQGRS